MIKKFIGIVLITGVMTSSVYALDKKISYQIINQCKYNIDKSGKIDSYFAGLITGLAQGYVDILSRSGIDNHYASLNAVEYGKRMCQHALWYRDNVNQETGGKYDVTQFYNDLQFIGYRMTLPSSYDTNTTK